MQGVFKRFGIMHVDTQTRRRTLELRAHYGSQGIASDGGAFAA